MYPKCVDCVICRRYLWDDETVSIKREESKNVHVSEITCLLKCAFLRTWSLSPNEDPDYERAHSTGFRHRSQPVGSCRGDLGIGNAESITFHEACWKLLKDFCAPHPIPLIRLLEVFDSVPFDGEGYDLCWDRKYRQILEYTPGVRVSKEFKLPGHYFHKWVWDYAKLDSISTSEVERLVRQRESPPAAWRQISSNNTRDCFLKMPWELLENMVLDLDTRTALSMRLISRAFLPLLTSGIFWASRFRPERERGFLHDVFHKKDGVVWIDLYRATDDRKLPFNLRARAWVWKMARDVVTLARLQLAEPVDDANSKKMLKNVRWPSRYHVTGQVIYELENARSRKIFQEGCRELGTHSALVPSQLVAITITTARVGATTYVAGICLLPKGGPCVRLGYTSQEGRHLHRITSLKGFLIAIGERGIHALRVVGENKILSPWIGDPLLSPITERLILTASLDCLKVGFDAYKLVSMAASSFSFGTDELRLPSSLRDTAYWFPTVPEESLCLNEKSFTGNALKKSEYEVLFWLPFGRKNGTGLKHIDGFLFSSGCNQSSIEIEYDDESDSDEDDEPSDVDRSIDTQSFRPYLARRLGLGEFDGSHGVRLDSGDGERLKSITVFDYKGTKVDDDLSIKHGTLCGFLIETTSGQRYNIGQTAGGFLRERRMKIAKGTTMTGFYTTCDPEAIFTGFGVISETLPNV